MLIKIREFIFVSYHLLDVVDVERPYIVQITSSSRALEAAT